MTGLGAYEYPIRISLWGTRDPEKSEALKGKMQGDRLPVKEYNEAKRAEAKRAKEAAAAEKKARAMALGKAAASWQNSENAMFANLSSPTGMAGESESMQELLSQSSQFNPRDIGQVVENFGQKENDMENMPMADTPAALATELLPYQRQGLAWLIDRENPNFPPPGSDKVVQLWRRSGKNFNNIATNFTTQNEPPLASGGILADDMGLGKTIQIISLILSNSAPRSAGASKSTLIIAPVGVMSNWRNQMHDHTRADSMPRVLIYHGSAKKEAKNFSEYDVVITSYGALGQEYNPDAVKPPSKGIFSVHWRRVVLDEGHQIRNPRSKAALAACSLRADSRWTLTGTPIINTLKDLYSQIRFLRLSGGLEEEPMFNTILIRPLTLGQPEARLLLEALMGTICLRRRKDMNFINLRLPEMTSRVLRVKFNSHERETYSAFQYVLSP